MLRARGTAAALLLAAMVIGLRDLSRRDRLEGYDAYSLPGFDAWVYVAAAEEPRVFTVGPWGYRVLTPWLARHVPAASLIEGFHRLTLLALVLATAGVFTFLRRRGYGELPSLLAMTAFAASPPLGAALDNPFLTEPVSLLLLMAFVLAVERHAPTAWLCLLAGVGALAREVLFPAVPIVYLEGQPRLGARRALARTAGIAACAAAAWVTLRLSWTPHLSPGAWWPSELGAGAWTGGRMTEGATVVAGEWRGLWKGALLAGITPLAVVGSLRRTSRGFLALYGCLIVLPLLAALGASLHGGDGTPLSFFADDFRRLALYALPFLLPLALNGAGMVPGAVPTPAGPPGALSRAGIVAGTAALAGLLGLGPDRYRRLDLRHFREGRYILTFCRQSLQMARHLDTGNPFSLSLDEHVFSSQASRREDMPRMRWFLGPGWGRAAPYGSGPALMESGEAGLVLPLVRATDIQVVLRLSGGQGSRLRLFANGADLGEQPLAGGPRDLVFRIPASALFRGDNLLLLSVGAGSSPIALYLYRAGPL